MEQNSLPLPRTSSPVIVHFLHFLLMNYGLKIGTANCDFPPLSIYHCSSFFLVAVPSFCSFFMSDRYRNMIVWSTLKDSYDLISISD